MSQHGHAPRLSMVGIVAVCIGLYYLLTVFLMLFVWVKTLPSAQLSEHLSQAIEGSAGPVLSDLSAGSFFHFMLQSSALARPTARLLRAVSILCLLLVLLIHRPLQALLWR